MATNQQGAKVGGAGSGRSTGKEERQAIAAAAKANRTQETAEFLEQEKQQRGDRLWKVVRVYPSGTKATLGTTNTTKDSIIGKRYGGGIYEYHELERATERETGKIVRATLHPAAYPAVETYSLDPAEFDLKPAAAPGPGGPLSAAGLTGLSREEIYERAKAEAKAEFMREETQRRLEIQLADISQRLDRVMNGEGPTRKDPLEQVTAMFDLFKKIMPTPQPSMLGGVQLTPQQQIQETVELVKSVQALSGGLLGDSAKPSPMAERLISSLVDLGQRGFTAWERNQAANPQGPRVIDQEERSAGWARTGSAPQPAPLAPGNGSAPAPQQRQQHEPTKSQPAPSADQRPQGWARTSQKPQSPQAASVAEQPAAVKASRWPNKPPEYQATRDDFASDGDWATFQSDVMTFELIGFVKSEMEGLISGAPGHSIFSTAEEIRGRWTEAGASEAWIKLRDGIRTYPNTVLVNHFVTLQPDLCPTQAHRDCLAALIDVLKEREGVPS